MYTCSARVLPIRSVQRSFSAVFRFSTSSFIYITILNNTFSFADCLATIEITNSNNNTIFVKRQDRTIVI